MNQTSITRHATVTVHDAGRAGITTAAAPEFSPIRAGGGIGERLHRITHSTAPVSAVLIRSVVGAVFLLEGILKFINPQEMGAGRFLKIGIPLPSFFGPFDGAFEIGCGVLLMLGLMTRLAAVPMIVNMIVAIASTKIPMLLQFGFWKAAHEARLDFTMLLACVFLLRAGAGPMSLDSHVDPGPGEDFSFTPSPDDFH